MWMNSLMQEQRGRRNPRSQRRLLKGIFSAYRLEVGFTRLLWGGVDVHLHIASKTKRLPHAAPFTISGLMALRCRFTKPAPWDKYNFIFNIWSDSTLRGDYLWRGLSHSTVTGSCTCTGQETSFLSCAIFNKTSLHTLCFLTEEHVKTQKEVIWIFDLVTHSSFIPVFFKPMP